MATRHFERALAMQALYSWEMNGRNVRSLSFEWVDTPDSNGYAFATLVASGTIESISKIDELIGNHLKNWTVDRINKVDQAILRITVYTLLYQKDIPQSVAINEAIQLAKEYSAPESYKFVNGVLDAIIKQ